MKRAGQIVLFRFPQTDLTTGKLRPALLVGRVPGPHDDWLACMISSQLRHYGEGFDEIIQDDDPDFIQSGLKVASVIRTGRLAVVTDEVLSGSIGEIDRERLNRVRSNLSRWVLGKG